MLTKSVVIAGALFCLTLVNATTAAGKKKDKTPAEKIKIEEKGLDTTYAVVGAVGAVIIELDTAQLTEKMHYRLRQSAAHAGADAVIFTKVVYPSITQLGLTPEMLPQIGNVLLIVGVAVKYLDEKGEAEWAKKHPRKEFNPKDPLEITEKDVKRAYDVIGVAYGYTKMGKKDFETVDQELTRFAKLSMPCFLADGCNALIFTEYDKKGWAGWGVLVTYLAP